MYQNKTILGVITARGGSKGVPGKNIRHVGGKPLLGWIIESAKESKYIDRLILSSDDQRIIDVAKDFDCEVPFVRPKRLAQDDSLTIDVVLHALQQLDAYDYVLLLQPTSPLTSPEDIDGCIKHCIGNSHKASVAVAEAQKSPHWMFRLQADHLMKPFMGWRYLNCRRQDLPSVFLPTGSVYVAECAHLREKRSFYFKGTSGYVVPVERALDIDSEIDFFVFEAILQSVKEKEAR
jgi:N-acylneuraminate cytidylyltransferase